MKTDVEGLVQVVGTQIGECWMEQVQNVLPYCLEHYQEVCGYIFQRCLQHLNRLKSRLCC